MSSIFATTTSDDFLGLCTTWCDEHNIGTLSDELIEKNSICIPEEGVTVEEVCSGMRLKEKYIPVLDGKEFLGDKLFTERIGKYTISSDEKRLVFVYRNGKTYVTRNTPEVLDELKANGYKEMSENYIVVVPFSSIETIVDIDLRKKWDVIIKRA